MSKVLFVSKDKGGAQVLIPLAKFVRKNGHEVVVVAEGLAAKQFEEAGFTLYFKGMVDFKEIPFMLDVIKVVENTKPDVIIVSAGFPINLEGAFAVASAKKGIPLVIMEDFWGGSGKLKGIIPQLILTLDAYGEKLVHEMFPDVPTEVIGHHELPFPITRLLYSTDEVLSSKKYTCVYIGAGYPTEAELKLLVDCLKMTDKEWCLIPCFHPKCINWKTEDGKRLEDIWNEVLKPISGRVHFISDPVESIIPLADIVVSGFSTLLNLSAYLGRTTASLQTTETLASIKEQAGLDKIPIIELGCAHVITEPISLDTLSSLVDMKESGRRLRPYLSETAFQAISQFL